MSLPESWLVKKGLFVWHCHLVDHEDNSMLRPMQVG